MQVLPACSDAQTAARAAKCQQACAQVLRVKVLLTRCRARARSAVPAALSSNSIAKQVAGAYWRADGEASVVDWQCRRSWSAANTVTTCSREHQR